MDPESTWAIQPASVTLMTTDSAGAAWDALGGAPDPFIVTFCPASATTGTPTLAIQDVFSATWTSSGSCTLKARELLSTGFAWAAYDEDAAADDVAAAKTTQPVTEAQLLAGSLTVGPVSRVQTLTFQLRRQ